MGNGPDWFIRATTLISILLVCGGAIFRFLAKAQRDSRAKEMATWLRSEDGQDVLFGVLASGEGRPRLFGLIDRRIRIIVKGERYEDREDPNDSE